MILAQMADPQVGFYDYEPEMQRLRKAIGRLNESDCEVVIVCGDMMHIVTRDSLKIFLKEMEQLKKPVFYVIGNHDVISNPESLSAYTELIGPRFYAVDLPDPAYRLIALDTFLWMDEPDSAACAEMDQFLLKELADAESAGKKIIIATHSAVFQDDPDEAEIYFNLPIPRRKWLLDLLKKYQVSALLSGHSHRAFTYTLNGTLFSSAETTSVAFDGVCHGFRRFVFKDGMIRFNTISVDTDPIA